MLSRWSKPIASLDFWAPIFLVHSLLGLLFQRAFLEELQDEEDEADIGNQAEGAEQGYGRSRV